MRVICVTLENFTGCSDDIRKFMSVGDEFNVVGELIGYGENGVEAPCYDLEPWANTEYVFDQRNFATLPDQTDDEMQEERREAIANLETILV